MIRTRRWLVAAALVTTSTGCGPSEEQKQELTEAEKTIEPAIAKLRAIDAALPDNASASEVPCRSAIPAETTIEISTGTLRYLLDENEDQDHYERARLSHGSFTKLNSPTTNARLRKEADTLNGTILNYRHATEELEAITHVAVFVPTTQDEGELGDRDAEGAYTLVRPANWDGWTYVATFANPPEIVAAFPMQQSSASEMTFMKQEGKRPSKTLLIEDAARRVRDAAFARITACPTG